jgi:hypothetical protein
MECGLGFPGEATGDALALGEGEEEADFLGIVCAVSGAEKARAAMHAPIVNFDLLFISWNLEDRDGPARVDAKSALLFNRL